MIMYIFIKKNTDYFKIQKVNFETRQTSFFLFFFFFSFFLFLRTSPSMLAASSTQQ